MLILTSHRMDHDTSQSSGRPIRVMHLLHTVAYGGVETVILNWIRDMDQSSFRVDLACFANPGATEQPFLDAAKEYGHTPPTIPWNRRKPIFKASRAVAQMVRDHQIDILHTHNTYADCVGAVVRRMTGVKTLTTLYVLADLGWKRNLLRSINLRAIRSFDAITAHCQETYDHAIRLGIPANRMRTLISGFKGAPVDLPADERSQSRISQGISDETVLLAYLARFYPEKAHSRLLRTFYRIHERAPQTHLWLVGVGPLEDEIRRECTELGLDDAVTFKGFSDDLPRLISEIDIQVHPSDMEGIPLALCSGLAAGAPLVCTDVGGVAEVIKNERTGLLVQHGDDEAFIQAVMRLIDDTDLRTKLGNGARAFIRDEFSLEKAVADLEQTYRDMLA